MQRTPSISANLRAVKDEPSDSLPIPGVKHEKHEANPADGDHDAPPDWAIDLIDTLEGSNVSSSLPRPPAEAMQALAGGPDWAMQLHQLLEGACAMANAKTEQQPSAMAKAEQQPSQAPSLRERLRPKMNLSLRIQHEDTSATPAVMSDGTIPPRAPTSEYEEAATVALKTVQAKRAEAAAEKKKTKAEEQLLKKCCR